MSAPPKDWRINSPKETPESLAQRIARFLSSGGSITLVRVIYLYNSAGIFYCQAKNRTILVSKLIATRSFSRAEACHKHQRPKCFFHARIISSLRSLGDFLQFPKPALGSTPNNRTKPDAPGIMDLLEESFGTFVF